MPESTETQMTPDARCYDCTCIGCECPEGYEAQLWRCCQCDYTEAVVRAVCFVRILEGAPPLCENCNGFMDQIQVEGKG